MVQQKPIFKIVKKSNMAAVMTIIIDNLRLKIQKSMRGSESFGQIFFIFDIKLTYNGATKTNI